VTVNVAVPTFQVLLLPLTSAPVVTIDPDRATK
jgi:hypothetical protein